MKSKSLKPLAISFFASGIWDTIAAIQYLFVIGIVDSFIGKKILAYIPQNKFRRLSLLFILIIGIISMSKFIIKVQ